MPQHSIGQPLDRLVMEQLTRRISTALLAFPYANKTKLVQTIALQEGLDGFDVDVIDAAADADAGDGSA